MLRITIDYVPLGVAHNSETIGSFDIINDGTGSHEVGNYVIKDGLHEDMHVYSHLRAAGFYPLLVAAAAAIARRDLESKSH